MPAFLNDADFALVVLVIAAFADVISTTRALLRGGREANPLLAKLMDRAPAIVWILVRLFGALFTGWIALRGGHVWMIWAAAGVILGVALRNSRVMR